jgi:hypothetical protein
MQKTSLDIYIYVYIYTYPILDGERHCRIFCKKHGGQAMFFARLHTKQITVVICIGEEVEQGNYGSKFEQVDQPHGLVVRTPASCRGNFPS